MITVLKKTEHTARKEYEDSAGVWISSCLSDIRWEMNDEISFSDWRKIARLKANNWNIKPGQRYVRVVGIDYEVGFCELKYLQEIHDICIKYKLYSD